MRKICIYTTQFFPTYGGIEFFVHYLSEELINQNFEITIVTNNLKKHNLRTKYKVIRTNSIIEKIKIFKKNNFVILINLNFSGLIPIILSRKKFLINHHINYEFKSLNKKINYLNFLKVFLTIFFKNICVSNYVSRKILGKSKIIHNFYNDNFFKKLNFEKKGDFIFCGRLVDQKGVVIIIEAIKILKKRFKSITCSIVGDGPELNKLKKLVKKYSLQKNIQFYGKKNNFTVSKIMNRHRCALIPSIWEEPYGIIALESLACCDHVISSNKGGLPEAINKYGTLTKPTISNFSKHMYLFLKKKKKLKLNKKMKKEKYLKNHSIKNVVKKYINFINENQLIT